MPREVSDAGAAREEQPGEVEAAVAESSGDDEGPRRGQRPSLGAAGRTGSPADVRSSSAESVGDSQGWPLGRHPQA
jgi:hypothetical protein